MGQSSDTPIDSDEQFVWPWTGIVVNIPTIKAKDGTPGEASGSKLKDEYMHKGFNSLKVILLWNPRGHTGTALVKFSEDWPDFEKELAFEKAYALEHRGKNDWFVNTQQKSGLYAWVARADDYKANDVIGKYLKNKADVKTIRELMEDADRKKDKLVSNLTNTLQVKRNPQ